MTATRALSLGLVLASMLVGWKSFVPHDATQEADQVGNMAAFVQASAALEAYRSQAGSFDGAELSPTSPVKIVWSSDTGYCLQSGTAHELGPGGLPQPGACPPQGDA
jgi:hypothetical protein